MSGGIEMLARLQQQLHNTYQTEQAYDVRDFLITDPNLARILSGNSVLTNNGETLLLCEDEDGLSLSLYLESELLERLDETDPASPIEPDQLDDLCKVIEGLSHFNYVVWRASRDRAVTLLELELQAEIDKFVSTMQLASEKQDSELMNVLHTKLFDDVRFSEDLDEEQAERYRAANEYAARFCNQLRNRFLQNDDGALPELRRFFRLPLRQKISHIHSVAFAAN
jgi:hypothetical protein